MAVWSVGASLVAISPWQPPWIPCGVKEGWTVSRLPSLLILTTRLFCFSWVISLLYRYDSCIVFHYSVCLSLLCVILLLHCSVLSFYLLIFIVFLFCFFPFLLLFFWWWCLIFIHLIPSSIICVLSSNTLPLHMLGTLPQVSPTKNPPPLTRMHISPYTIINSQVHSRRAQVYFSHLSPGDDKH